MPQQFWLGYHCNTSARHDGQQARLASKLVRVERISVALMTVDGLSAATRKELELWGQHLVHAREAEIYEPNLPPAPTVIVEMHRAAAVKAYLIAEADRAIKETVFRAREQGLSWHTIGNALGITGEAARQRYSDR